MPRPNSLVDEARLIGDGRSEEYGVVVKYDAEEQTRGSPGQAGSRDPTALEQRLGRVAGYFQNVLYRGDPDQVDINSTGWTLMKVFFMWFLMVTEHPHSNDP